ncbi:MAG: MFS transporter [Acidobacteria bacterium]|nr:MFS transporter [Acidobacteriota bacterium]
MAHGLARDGRSGPQPLSSGVMLSPEEVSQEKPGALMSIWLAMRSWRTASVVLLSFASGLPLGLVWIAIPDWMRSGGVDIRIVGLITLAHAPWSFKLLWSPLMDRYRLPWLGRRRGWIALAQIALLALTLSLAGLGDHPDTPWVLIALAFAIAFASASQDIAYDAYTVDVLRREEQGIAVGAKTAMYRAAMYLAGASTITLASIYSWPLVIGLLAACYIPMLIVTWKAPESNGAAQAPKSMKEAVWNPFLGFLGRHRALEILAFVFFYKFADNLAEALLRPFLVDMGYSATDRGVGLATIGLFAMLAGVLLGGVLTTTMGLGHSLWLFGFLQIFSNIGYVLLARSEPDRLLMYGAMAFENAAKGLGTGAFMVLLLRMTQKRFSATQYALFSSLFALPRIISGPISGFTVDAFGWEAFFWGTFIAGIPGLLLLQRFAPLGTRDPQFTIEEVKDRRRLTPRQLSVRGVVGGIAGSLFATVCVATLSALGAMRSDAVAGFDLDAALANLANPADIGGWLQLIGILTFGAIVGLMTAAVFAARHGEAGEIARNASS